MRGFLLKNDALLALEWMFLPQNMLFMCGNRVFYMHNRAFLHLNIISAWKWLCCCCFFFFKPQNGEFPSQMAILISKWMLSAPEQDLCAPRWFSNPKMEVFSRRMGSLFSRMTKSKFLNPQKAFLLHNCVSRPVISIFNPKTGFCSL